MTDFDYPYRIDPQGLTARAGEEEHVRDMIEQFLFTNPGERVNRPDFGSGLLQLVFAPNSEELAAALQFTVQAGLEQWLGDRIDIDAVQVTAQDSTLRVLVRYRLKGGGETRVEEFSREL